MKCETCKHYDKFNGTAAPGLQLGRCYKAVPFWDATTWSEEEPHRVLDPQYADNKMFVQDASDYSAMLYTTPDFFCAHYEERKP